MYTHTHTHTHTHTYIYIYIKQQHKQFCFIIIKYNDEFYYNRSIIIMMFLCLAFSLVYWEFKLNLME